MNAQPHNAASPTAAHAFRVEGHGASLLVVQGGDIRVGGRRPNPLLTREQAWAAAKKLVARGVFHTVQVCRGCDVVWSSQAVA